MTRYIHGETDAAEIDRLEKQARFLTRWILDGVEAGPGARVLDLACGTGAMMRRLAARLPDALLIGADVSLEQLRAARSRSPELALVNGDANALPFRNGAFDVVHWSWLLEHLPPSRAVDLHRRTGLPAPLPHACRPADGVPARHAGGVRRDPPVRARVASAALARPRRRGPRAALCAGKRRARRPT